MLPYHNNTLNMFDNYKICIQSDYMLGIVQENIIFVTFF